MRAWCVRASALVAAGGAVLAIAVTPASAAPTGVMPADGSRHHVKFLATVLKGANEVPGPGDEDGRGVFVATVKGDRICYVLTQRNLDTVTMAHIHTGTRDVAGPIAVGLVPPVNGISADCIRAVPDGPDDPMTLSTSELAAIRANSSGYYVNVHTELFGPGAIRGQL
jgi:CHRD domain